MPLASTSKPKLALVTLAVTPPPDKAALTPVPATSSKLPVRVKPKVPLSWTAPAMSTVTLPLACNKVPRLPAMLKLRGEAPPVLTLSVVLPAL